MTSQCKAEISALEFKFQTVWVKKKKKATIDQPAVSKDKKKLYSVHKRRSRALTPAATSPVLKHISTRWNQREAAAAAAALKRAAVELL